MPTGYTDCIGKGVSFEEFVWRCARAMGALVMMRDEPFGAAIPQAFQSDDFHAREAEKARARLFDCERMSIEEARAEAERRRAEHDRMIAEMSAERRDLKIKYEAMLSRVQAWNPPTKDHEGLREFMIEQIKQSIDFDCIDAAPDPVDVPNGKEWKAQQIQKAASDIARHMRMQREEDERTRARNEWIAALRASVPVK